MKKLIIISLALVLVLATVISVVAAQTGTVTITPNTTTLYAGSTVTFTVKVTGVTAAKSIGVIPSYDTNVFDLVSGEWLVSGSAMSDFSGGTATIAYAYARAFNENVFKFTLKVKSNAKLGQVTVNATVSIKNGNSIVIPAAGFYIGESMFIIEIFAQSFVDHLSHFSTGDQATRIEGAIVIAIYNACC